MEFFKKHTGLAMTLKILFSLLLLGGGGILWMFGGVIIAFEFIQQTALFTVWTLLMLSGI